MINRYEANTGPLLYPDASRPTDILCLLLLCGLCSNHHAAWLRRRTDHERPGRKGFQMRRESAIGLVPNRP